MIDTHEALGYRNAIHKAVIELNTAIEVAAMDGVVTSLKVRQTFPVDAKEESGEETQTVSAETSLYLED